MKRRQFITNAGISFTLLALYQNKGFAALLQDPAYKLTLLRNDVGIFTEQGGTIGWMVNKDGIVVVDSQFVDPARHLITELKKKSAKPFKYLINTHHHGDHSGGNMAFKGIAEHVVAHKNSASNQKRVALEQKKDDQQLYPDLTFDKTWKAKVGNQKIVCKYFGAAHTNGDSIIHFQNANIAHMGDLVFNRRFPFIDRTSGASVAGWIEVLEKTLKEFDSDTQYIFGHALDPQKVTGTKEDVKAMQNFLEKMLAFVGNQIKSGKSKDDILKAESIPGAEDFKGQGIQRSLTAAYEELTVTL